MSEVSPAVRYEVSEAGVATLTLDRPDKRNAMMPPDWGALEDGLDEAAADDAVKVIVVTGAGGTFCSGGDLKTMGERLEQSPVKRSTELHRLVRSTQRFRETLKPVIGAVNGPAIGAGCVLALACDVRLAAASASFSVPFLRIGMQPDFGGAYFLPRILGTAKTFELLWMQDSLSAAQAEELGVVNRVFPDDEFVGGVRAFAERVARNPPGALAMSKLTVYHGAEQSLRELLDLEALAQTVLSKSDDAREGVQAFVEKRRPRFRGA
ncbi:MAG: enoyl-CoA hydratase-related protein [Candidatus Binatia bacterium]|nr:enoyl-CoA hydratase-related protein [Candidatus Binatia bacterium]